MPGIVDYLQRYPAMDVSTVFVDRVTNLLEEGIDVGIRIGELPDSSMRAVPVGQVRRMIIASPSYIEKHGAPRTPQELEQHTIVASSGSSVPPDWRFQNGAGTQSLRVKPRLGVNNNGFGIARLLSYQAAALLDAGELVEVLQDYATPAVPIHIIHRDSHQGSTRIRSFVDLMAERLRTDPRLHPVR
jgi:DNA-binding transcriptional LysR family regulator